LRHTVYANYANWVVRLLPTRIYRPLADWRSNSAVEPSEPQVSQMFPSPW